jgi:hypothetical protein
MSSDLTAAPEAARDPVATPAESPNWPWPPQPSVPSHRALEIATADAVQVYGENLACFRIEITLEDDGWHIAHFIHQRKGSRIAGGGPHYVIDATTGEIVSKKYYQ